MGAGTSHAAVGGLGKLLCVFFFDFGDFGFRIYGLGVWGFGTSGFGFGGFKIYGFGVRVFLAAVWTLEFGV